MAEPENVFKKLAEKQAELTERADAMTAPEDAERVAVMQTLALIAQGLVKVGRDLRDVKRKVAKMEAPKPADE